MPRKYVLLAFVVAVMGGGALVALVASIRADESSPAPGAGRAAVRVARGPFVRTLRLTGIIESVRYHNVAAPRLVGVTGPSTLIITRLARGGSQVSAGDLLVEFDRQTQLKAAFDRRAAYLDFEEQIRKRSAERDRATAQDDAELAVAGNAVDTARLEMKKNELLPRILAEKNSLRMEEAQARLRQLQQTFELKRRAEAAELRILEIQRDRARTAMEQAELNGRRMVVTSPIPGVVVLRMNWRGDQTVEIQEGEEARPGMPIMLVVDPSAMLVRVKINQADLHVLRAGQRARISLDAYPELEFQGRVEQLAPSGTPSRLTDRVRNFVAIVSIQGNHPKLMPDLSAAVDVELERTDNAIVVPRDAIAGENGNFTVRVVDGDRIRSRAVILGPMNDHEAVVASGLQPGESVQRHVAR
jgi:multidrug efflux pump subunit AcrA (membrane-fusion protein)